VPIIVAYFADLLSLYIPEKQSLVDIGIHTLQTLILSINDEQGC
jgi:hypothetical protein